MFPLIRLGFKELKAHFSFSLFFTLNLALGLLGFILLDSFQVSFKSHIDEQSRSLLGADLRVRSYAPQPDEVKGQITNFLGGDKTILERGENW